jgi:hypothetical protein
LWWGFNNGDGAIIVGICSHLLPTLLMCIPYSLMCDWVRKPAFSAVLSYKTAACFNRDQCATLNLTFSIGVLRLKCRCWNGSLTVPNTKKNDLTRHKIWNTLKIIQLRTVVAGPFTLVLSQLHSLLMCVCILCRRLFQ